MGGMGGMGISQDLVSSGSSLCTNCSLTSRLASPTINEQMDPTPPSTSIHQHPSIHIQVERKHSKNNRAFRKSLSNEANDSE